MNTAMNDRQQAAPQPHFNLRGRFAATWVALALLIPVAIASAAPTQEEVFRSIQENVGESANSGHVLALFADGAGVLILLAVFSQRPNRVVAPKTLHHQGKLLKEIMKSVPLRSAELKQLKMLAEESARRDGVEPLQSPLTLLLCPSVLAKALRSRPAKLDRKVLAGIVRKLGTKHAAA